MNENQNKLDKKLIKEKIYSEKDIDESPVSNEDTINDLNKEFNYNKDSK